MTLNKQYNFKSKPEYISKFLSIFNCILPEENHLTKTELLIFSEFLSLDDSYDKKRYSSKGINKVYSNLKERGFIISKQSIYTYIYSLIDKNFIIKQEDNYKKTNKIIEDLIKKNENNTEITFKLILDADNS